MIRRKLIAGNWKMHGDRQSLAELEAIATHAGGAVDVAIAVPATLIAWAAERAPGLLIGAQDIHGRDRGPHTGCISATMAHEAGARFAIVGHSERRAAHGEDNALVKGKAEAAHRHGLQAILCVGERLFHREGGAAEAVVTQQVAESLPDGAAADWLAIGYEPVWAVGTGHTPTVEEIGAMHRAIRALLRGRIGADADRVRILYGGSVTATNAEALLSDPDVDGALVGGASLTAAAFVPIIEAAARVG